jgi:hypothetical protein
VRQLVTSLPDITISLHIASWQVVYAQKWLQNFSISLVPVERTYIPTPEGRLLWTKSALANTDFDFLVSDNLLEVTEFNQTLAIVGSFLWGEDNYKFWNDPLWIIANKLKTPIFGLDFLSMPAVRGLSGFQPVGLIGKCENHEIKSNEILFSFGRSDASKALCDSVRNVVCPNGRLIDGIVFDDVRSDEQVGDYSADFYSRFCSAVIRPGIGTVSDCLRYGIPMVIFHECGNDEMEWNTKVLVENGLATIANTADEILTKAYEWNDRNRRTLFHQKRHSLRWDGEKEIASGIMGLLEEKL